MRKSNAAHFALLVSHVHAGATQDNVKVHTVDTDGRVVFDTQIDVFLDTESTDLKENAKFKINKHFFS